MVVNHSTGKTNEWTIFPVAFDWNRFPIKINQVGTVFDHKHIIHLKIIFIHTRCELVALKKVSSLKSH